MSRGGITKEMMLTYWFVIIPQVNAKGILYVENTLILDGNQSKSIEKAYRSLLSTYGRYNEVGNTSRIQININPLTFAHGFGTIYDVTLFILMAVLNDKINPTDK